MDELKDATTGSVEPKESEQEIPSGILRLRQEWHKEGLPVYSGRQRSDVDNNQVIFTESADRGPVGDYTLEEEEVRARLRLSPEAFDRLIAGGGLDSILVKGDDGSIRRLISVSSLERFEVDSALDPEGASLPMTNVLDAVEQVRQEMEQMKSTQAKQLQQFKDILLLELRNLKEQDRDLTSYIFELSQQIDEILPKKKRR